MDDAGPWRAPRRQTRSAVGSPPTERSRPTIASIARRVDGAKFVVLKSFHSLVDVVRGASQPLRGRVSANMNVRDPRSPTVLAMSTAPCASRPGDLLFTRRRRQRHLAPCPPSDARTVHEASVTAAARLPGVTGGRIDEASRARRRRGHHVECPRTPQTSLGPGSASALRSAKVASWQSRRRRFGASGQALASHGLRLAAVEGDQRTRCAAAAVLHVGCRALVKCGVDYVARTRPNVWQREALAASRWPLCHSLCYGEHGVNTARRHVFGLRSASSQRWRRCRPARPYNASMR